MNSFIIGFVVAVFGIIVGVVAGFVMDNAMEDRWKADELVKLREKGYNYFIKGDEIIVYKRIKDGRLVREVKEIEEIIADKNKEKVDVWKKESNRWNKRYGEMIKR